MQLWQRSLNDDELRRMLRVAFGCVLGFIACKTMDWNFGVFYTVTPVLLLGIIPVFNWKSAVQNIGSSLVGALQVGLISGIFGSRPIIMTLLTFAMFVFWFLMMAKGWMTFGGNGALYASVMLHFASYQSVDVNDMIANNIWASIITSAIAALMMWLLPPSKPPGAPPASDKNKQRVRHEVLMGSVIATVSFLAFQVLDLKDSLSAQVTTILLLFPMHWNGSLAYARYRTTGVLIGVGFGIAVQLLLYDHNNSLLLYTPLLWLGIFWFCHAHLKEGRASGIGFSAMTTTGILFGQYLTPNGGMIFSALYRFSSVAVAAIFGLMCCYLMHRLLNFFESTRFVPIVQGMPQQGSTNKDNG
ncbi:DUF2955 domain-containing protein [Celerinatantimonas yamalensis]|uniref:DUF2955 domain-containing protein n=1 Tax=Celerinatantimonas yamalensis TaxID=559956 RepID=A0ABW9GBM4_9GAMM